MQLLIAGLRDYREMALFLSFAIGCWPVAIRFGLFSLGIVTGASVPGPQFFPASMK
jgi:hypothetical protein